MQTPPPADNISKQLVDLAPEDQVYRTSEGYVVKVKTLLDEQQSSRSTPVFRLTGSICGNDGKALRLQDSRFAIYDLAQTAHLNADRLGDPLAGLEDARLRCVAAPVLAEKTRQIIDWQLGRGAGIATVASRQARQDAERANREAGLSGSA